VKQQSLCVDVVVVVVLLLLLLLLLQRWFPK
jgi:hypothetical protein